jgi:hypothetical protein
MKALELNSGIKALRYGNPLINKYHATEPGHDLEAVSISELG